MSNTRPSTSAHAKDIQRMHLIRLSALPRINDEAISKPQESKKWISLVAGGAGGVTAAILTAPLDVLRTRLQSEFYRPPTSSTFHSYFSPPSASILAAPRTLSPIHHIRTTIHLLITIHRLEGARALFKGVGPLVAGLGPSSALKFWTYGAVKGGLEKRGVQGGWLHGVSAAVAGGAVCTVMCPVWVVKTRLQLDPRRGGRYNGAIDCVGKIVRGEGWRGLWRGVGASYLGVGETVVQWVVYERVKGVMREREAERMGREKEAWDRVCDGVGWVLAAGASKSVAVGVAYPHEVLRTRLRQAPVEGVLKYTGIVQCARLVVREEGLSALYGGLTPHLMRAVPASAIMFGVFEVVTRVLGGEGK